MTGDPSRLAQALITLSDSGALSRRFIAGADAMGAIEQNLDTIRGQIDADRDLSASLSYDASGSPGKSPSARDHDRSNQIGAGSGVFLCCTEPAWDLNLRKDRDPVRAGMTRFWCCSGAARSLWGCTCAVTGS